MDERDVAAGRRIPNSKVGRSAEAGERGSVRPKVNVLTSGQRYVSVRPNNVSHQAQGASHVRPKERYEMYKVLEEEEKRLEQLEDEHGLRTQEIKQLAHLRKIRQDREEQKKQRKAKQDYMQLVNS
ncbi:hypothetical protein CYMTET_54294 [Cymbomonas tetramitiformis]|uniref:Uncharacterized protein n=1 Tax=Cymbomonas tetramitiformis TaxID=36881 RepID=A0AAE0EQW0_9CHLO|nr:hypothetical protein CYMTET_54294 [Cymbomonas tetramitiformis]